MKLKKDIVLGNIDGSDFAIATGKLAKKFKGIITNNKTAAYIFELLKTERTEEEIVRLMCEKYDAPESEIRQDVSETLEIIKNLGILE